MTIEVRGAEQLDRIGRRFKEAGEKELRKELLAGIRKSNKPTISAIRANARGSLPRRGGFADQVAASRIATRTRLVGKSAGVQIRALGMYNLRQLNRGRLRHPLFGNREHWYEQQIEPGWFSEPIEKDAPRIRADIEAAMQDVARKIEKGH